MTNITDNGYFDWDNRGLKFTGQRENSPSSHRYGPNGDTIKATMLRVTRHTSDTKTELGLIGQETTGKWFYIMAGQENMYGGMSQESWRTRYEAAEALSNRITDNGTIRNRY